MPYSTLLDRPSELHRNDPKGMYGLAVGFPAQLRSAAEIARNAELPTESAGVSNVVVTGLGGSAAGGDFARALFESEGRVPLSVNRDYRLPRFAGSNTLVFATSYSGNTEETLSAYDDARARKCRIVVVTSGGELAQRAERDGVPVVRIPGGQPPRTAMGFMLVPLLVLAERLGLLQPQDVSAAADAVESAGAAWLDRLPTEKNVAKQLAMALYGAVGTLYGLESWAAVVANRWKGQINENAKQHIFANVFPELNHNEILAWEGARDQGVSRWVTLFLGAGAESPRSKLRAQVTERLIQGATSVYWVPALGTTLLARMLTLASLGDFVSLYLAALRGVDPYTIRSIDETKAELSRQPSS